MKKEYFVKGIVIIGLAFLISACSKDEFMTAGELNAQKIQSAVDSIELSYVNIYKYQWNDIMEEEQWVLNVRSPDYEIEGSFIRVIDFYYNLEKLHKFRINGIALEIYLTMD